MMNYFDIIFLIILIYSAYKGFSRGFIVQLASLAALILGIYGAIRFSDYTSTVLVERLDLHSPYMPLISFAITFVAIVIVVHFVARITEKLLQAVALGFVNRILGLLFSLVKTVLILSVLLVFLNSIDRQMNFLPKDQLNDSLLYRPLSRIVPSIFPYLNFQKMYEETEGRINDVITSLPNDSVKYTYESEIKKCM